MGLACVRREASENLDRPNCHSHHTNVTWQRPFRRPTVIPTVTATRQLCIIGRPVFQAEQPHRHCHHHSRLWRAGEGLTRRPISSNSKVQQPSSYSGPARKHGPPTRIATIGHRRGGYGGRPVRVRHTSVPVVRTYKQQARHRPGRCQCAGSRRYDR